MPTVTVDSVLNRAGVLLQDTTNIRWTRNELLDWLNDGQREVVLRKPNAYTKNMTVNLVAGTKQAIPNDGVQLLKVVRNMPGKAIRIVDSEILDSQVPDWHTLTPNSAVQHYCYDESDLKNFYVYPPNNGAGSVEIVYSAAPPNAVLGGVISVDDIYQAALLDYILYRAYTKDFTAGADAAKATGHYGTFMNSLGGKAQVESAINPNLASPGKPNLRT
jgi:hypothetical protein